MLAHDLKAQSLCFYSIISHNEMDTQLFVCLFQELEYVRSIWICATSSIVSLFLQIQLFQILRRKNSVNALN